jgi:guanylate kinase
MEQMINNGEFIEYAEFGGNIYGTSRCAIEEIQRTGRICVLDLELQGVRNIKKLGMPAKFILIRAPSIEVLVSSD